MLIKLSVFADLPLLIIKSPLFPLSLNEFENEHLKVEFKNYYFSNVIARASKTMLDCSNSKIEIKKTGTEG